MDDYEKAKNGLIPVTIDLIKELRLRGYKNKANDLIKKFRENCDTQIQDEEKRLISIDNKIIRFLKKADGLCVVCGIREPYKNLMTCKHCIEKKRQCYYRKKLYPKDE